MFNSAITFAGKQPTVWFGAKWGYNGLAIVPRKVNKKYVTISTRVNPVVDANLFFDASGHLNVTDKAKWSGDVSIVPKGPYCGTVLGHQARLTNELSASYMNFHDTINVCVDLPNDTDNDKMLDSWEMENFGNLGQAAADDPDFDGISNLEEFYNGTDPNENKEIFAFPPLHRYPYSNGFYAGPDVNLEWFGSTTLGRYEVEVAIWPDCEKAIYRAEVYNTNNIGDPIVHTADLGEGIGTQCAYRIRAAFTNSTGWTDWNNWQPFKVLEPLTDHTLYLENGEPLRGCYFFFWDWAQATNHWPTATNSVFWPFDWHTNDNLCSENLHFLKNEMEVNTVFLDQWAWKVFVGGVTISNMPLPGEPPENTNIFDLTYWSTQFDRDVPLCKSNNVEFLPWLSLGEHLGMGMTHYNTQNETNQQMYTYLEKRFGIGQIEKTLWRRWPGFYQSVLADITGTNYQIAWIEFIDEYISHYTENPTNSLNALVQVSNRGTRMPVVAPIVEHRINYIRDFAGRAIGKFQIWLAGRYGIVDVLNEAWDTEYVALNDINPQNEDGTVFCWEARTNKVIRACDDFDEFTIERNVGGWLTIREELLKRRNVCLAVEHISPFYDVVGGKAPPRSTVPVHRIDDFADIVIQRHGYDLDTDKQRMAYADWLKSGKYVVFAGMASTTRWAPLPGTNHCWRFYAEHAMHAGDNAAIYSWNELNSVDYRNSLVKNIVATNHAKRYLDWISERDTPLNINSDYELGVNKFLRGWTFSPSSRCTRSTKRSISGKACLKITGGGQCKIISDSVSCSGDKSYGLLLYARPERVPKGEQVSIAIQVDNTTTRTVWLDNEGWDSDSEQSSRTVYEAETGHNLTDVVTMSSVANAKWLPIFEFYEILDGNKKINLTITLPSDCELYLDDACLIELP